MIFKRHLSCESDFNIAFKLYEDSFPEHERRSKKAHLEAMNNKEFHSTSIYEDDLFIGIMFYWKTEKFTLIEHFAICEDIRGKNYGSKVMKEFCKSHRDIILEIEPPIDEYTKKRLKFYEKLDFVLSDFHYIHPSYLKNGASHRLDVMSYKKKLTEIEFEDFLKFVKNETLKYID